MPQVAKVWHNNAFCSLFWATFSAHVATLQSVQTSQRGYLHFNVCSSIMGAFSKKQLFIYGSYTPVNVPGYLTSMRMRKSNNLPKSRMTVCVGPLAFIVTFVVDSSWYTPCSTRYAITPLGSFGGFQVMLTEVSVFSSYLSSDTGPGAVGKERVHKKIILVKYWQHCTTIIGDMIIQHCSCRK